MGTVSHGSDTARLREIGAALNAQADVLGEARRDSALRDTRRVLDGPDLEVFGAEWETAGSASDQAADRLREFARRALTQAEEQDLASGTNNHLHGGSGVSRDAIGTDGGPLLGGSAVTMGIGGARAEDDPDVRAREAPRDATTEHRHRDQNRDPEITEGEERPPAGPSLGEPVKGTSLPETPQPPPWSPPDGGAGEYGSEFAGPVDYSTEAAARTGAGLKDGDWPDAADNLRHYLDNSGEPLEQDVDQMLEDVPGLADQATAERQDVAADAVADAQARGITEPVTYPVHTPWDSYYIGKDQSENWFYATGGMEYSQTGSVTVYPPEQPGGPYRYEMNTTLHYQDQYNWDGTKSTQIGPLTVTDAQLAALIVQGSPRSTRCTASPSPPRRLERSREPALHDRPRGHRPRCQRVFLDLPRWDR